MRIDTHQHFWRYDPGEYAWINAPLAALQRDFLPDDVAPEMAALGFEGCIAVQARQTSAETPALLALADAHPFILGVVGWVDLQAESARAELDVVAGHPKLVGVRHIVQSEPDDYLARPEFHRGIAHLADLDLTYDVLVYERQMPAAVEFVAQFPAQRFILDHLGKPDIRRGRLDEWARHLRMMAAYPNVWCKLSGLVTEADWSTWTPDDLRPYIDVAVDAFGPDRLMIGSDWPVCTVAGSYARTMALVIDAMAEWPSAARNAVLGGTAERVWSLPRRKPQDSGL